MLPGRSTRGPYHPRVRPRRIPFLLFAALAALAIYTFGWRDGDASDEDRERAKARAWAQVVAVTGEDGVVRRLERVAPFYWTVVVDKASGPVCFEMYVDPSRVADLPGFEHGTVAEVGCPQAVNEL
jgi:hypothetical protein